MLRQGLKNLATFARDRPLEAGLVAGAGILGARGTRRNMRRRRALRLIRRLGAKESARQVAVAQVATRMRRERGGDLGTVMIHPKNELAITLAGRRGRFGITRYR